MSLRSAWRQKIEHKMQKMSEMYSDADEKKTFYFVTKHIYFSCRKQFFLGRRIFPRSEKKFLVARKKKNCSKKRTVSFL